jgi:hypothetical protein
VTSTPAGKKLCTSVTDSGGGGNGADAVGRPDRWRRADSAGLLAEAEAGGGVGVDSGGINGGLAAV